MSVNVGTLVIDLRANTASFTSAMGKAEQLTAKTANGVKRSLETIAAMGTAVGVAIAAGSAKMISSALDSASAMARLAEAAGTTTETLSELAYAAGLSHVATEDLGKGLEKLSKSAFGAQNGNVELQRIFARLGISVTDSNGHLKDSGQLMEEIAPKFAAMGSGAGKTALAMSLFGKAGAGMIPFMNEYGARQAAINKEAQQFGLILGSDVAEKSKQAQQNLERLEMIVTGVGRAALGSTLPALIGLGDRLIEIAKEANIPDLAKSFGSEVTGAVNALGTALEFTVKHTTELKYALEGLAALRLANIAIPLVQTFNTAGAIGGIEKLGVSLLGLKNLMPVLGDFARWVSYSTKFIALLASEEGIAAAASYVLGGALTAVSAPFVAIPAAIIAAGAALFAFRNSVFTLNGTAYEVRDIWNAAWIAIGKGFTNLGDKFRPVVDEMKKLWSGFANWFSSMSIVSTFKKWFGEAIDWAAGILGKLTPQWAIDSLNQAKSERQANSGSGKGGAAPPPPNRTLPPPDTSGLGAPKKDIYGDEIKKLDQAIAAQKAYLSVIADSPDRIAEVAAAEKARGVIVEMNTRLLDAGRAALTKTQEANITSRVATEASTQALVEYGRQLIGEQHSAELTTKQTTLMTGVLFSGEEATRTATIENALLGLQYNKTGAELAEFLKLQPALRAALQGKSDSGALGDFAKSIEQQTRSAKLATAEAKNLAAAELLGEGAVRRATIENELYGLSFGKTTAEMAAMKDQLAGLASLLAGKQNAELVESSNQEIRAMQQELAGRKLVIAASLQYTDAMRDAELQSKVYALNQQIAATTDAEAQRALLSKRDAIVDLAKAEWEEADARAAAGLRDPLDVYRQEVADIQRTAAELVKLQGTNLTYAESLNVAVKEQEAFNKGIDEEVKALTAVGSLSDGVKAFFLDMQKSAQSAASIIYESMKSAFDKISDQLALLVTGGKTSFAKMFEDLGRQMLGSTIKSGLQQGLSALAKQFPGMNAKGGAADPKSPMSTIAGVLGLGKPGGGADGSSGNPFYVVLASGGMGTSSGSNGILGKLMSALGIGQPQGTGHPDGTQSNPFYTVQAQQQGSQGGGLGGLLGMFGGGASGGAGASGGDGLTESVTSSIDFGGGFASGGTMSADKAYLVGEQGPEILSGVGGQITNNSASRRMLQGAGGDTHNYTIDARGTDPVLTEQRVRQAIMASHQSAVTKSIQANVEMRKRSPSR